jgi:Ca2+-binding EF-hand superfamily protein
MLLTGVCLLDTLLPIFALLLVVQVMYEEGEGETVTKVDEALRKKVLDSHDTMKKAFKRADTDKSGTLGFAELRRVVDYYHIDCTDAEFAEFFKAYDVNGDGQFSYNEFVKLLQSQAPAVI